MTPGGPHRGRQKMFSLKNAIYRAKWSNRASFMSMNIKRQKNKQQKHNFETNHLFATPEGASGVHFHRSFLFRNTWNICGWTQFLTLILNLVLVLSETVVFQPKMGTVRAKNQWKRTPRPLYPSVSGQINSFWAYEMNNFVATEKEYQMGKIRTL